MIIRSFETDCDPCWKRSRILRSWAKLPLVLRHLDLLMQLQLGNVRIKVIVLSMHDDQEHVLTALQNGAMGYILKDYGVAELTRAVREVIQGHHYLSSSLANHVITSFLAKSYSGKANRREGLGLLTDR